jgi:hypothetical protein
MKSTNGNFKKQEKHFKKKARRLMDLEEKIIT